jgi:hypothetical protein
MWANNRSVVLKFVVVDLLILSLGLTRIGKSIFLNIIWAKHLEQRMRHLALLTAALAIFTVLASSPSSAEANSEGQTSLRSLAGPPTGTIGSNNEEVPSVPLACGSSRTVHPVGSLRVEGTYTPPSNSGKTPGMSVSECCSAAEINCSNRLVNEVNRKTPAASCTGCTCPFCGAVSCTPTRELDIAPVLQDIKFGTCTAYGPVNAVTDCRVSCYIEDPSSVDTKIGCTKCKRGHLSNTSEPSQTGSVTGTLIAACPEAEAADSKVSK